MANMHIFTARRPDGSPVPLTVVETHHFGTHHDCPCHKMEAQLLARAERAEAQAAALDLERQRLAVFLDKHYPGQAQAPGGVLESPEAVAIRLLAEGAQNAK